ncbi:flocculation protein FLO11-like [Miscanthus floridulus]|uniref:flocculation protein FLO11-like n=1 Tax=Miscanthus floridulus TaxID=154761 RepID=UPI003459CB76
MRRSTSAAATPPAPTSPKPGATKRQRKSVPLGDVTNLLLRPETPTPIKPRRTARRPLPAPSDASAVSSSTCSSSASVTPALKPSSSASATPAPQPSSSAPVTPAPEPSSSGAATPAPEPSFTASATPALEPSSAATVTPAPKPSFAAVLDEEGSVFESPTICTVYARRRTTEAEAEAEGRGNPTITSKGKGKEPAGAAVSCPPLGKSTRNIRKKDTRLISSSAPCREAKKKRPLAKTPKLPEEFVKKQKAYFADVDAFELAEEEVSESELE